MSIRTTVNTPAGKQVVSIYMVQKGASKTYTEMKSPLLNQRSIVNGSRMKVVDLNTKNLKFCRTMAKPWRLNPIRNSILSIPVIGRNRFMCPTICILLRARQGVLYYDSAKKRIEKIESNDAEKNTLTYFYL
jgi:hypothetical protein